MGKKGARTREPILERAVAIASRDGLEGLTIGGLAKDLDLSKSGLIAHFGTKEALDLAALQTAAALFGNTVIVPAARVAAGEPRLRALFDGWFRYANLKQMPGGDIFLSAATELDDKPGVCRYYVARVHKDWITAIESATREAKNGGQFRDDLDPTQIAFNILAILQAYNTFHRLLNASNAEARARAAFESLMARARAEGLAAP
ncbi:MAG: TetR/AcrR family transcriptional regulator, partial [Alphaproteobacteria bacterium]|nr:TetR/AcrR family transcriptional regulator [Alphaproteobacteria bacterium]